LASRIHPVPSVLSGRLPRLLFGTVGHARNPVQVGQEGRVLVQAWRLSPHDDKVRRDGLHAGACGEGKVCRVEVMQYQQTNLKQSMSLSNVTKSVVKPVTLAQRGTNLNTVT
jgi:hypothetical protein